MHHHAQGMPCNQLTCVCVCLQSLKEQVESKLDDMQQHINQLSGDVSYHQNQLNDNIMKLEEIVFENERINR